MGPHQPAKEADMCDFHDVVNYVMSGLIILAVTTVMLRFGRKRQLV